MKRVKTSILLLILIFGSSVFSGSLVQATGIESSGYTAKELKSLPSQEDLKNATPVQKEEDRKREELDIEDTKKEDINNYIKKNRISPSKITYDLHTWQMFNYTGNKPKGIVIHETANPGSSIENEIKYMEKHWKSAFVHAFADKDHIIEVHRVDKGAWGAGPYANAQFIQIELVESKKLDDFARSVSNQAYFTAMMLKKYNLKPTLASGKGKGTIWSHNDVTRYLGGTDHTDPTGYFKKWGYSMDKFYELVKFYLETSNGNNESCNVIDRETENDSGVYTKRESSDGQKVCETKVDPNGENIYYKENVYYKNWLKYKEYIRNYQNGENLNTFDKRYYIDRKLSAYFEQRYNGKIKYKDYQRTYYTNGNFKETKQNDNNSQTGKQKDYKETTYDSNFRVTKEYIRSCFANGVKKMTQDKRYSNKKFTHYYEYRYNDKNKILKKYIRDYQNGKFYLTKENDNDANGVIKEYKEANYQSGKRMREYTRIYKNGKAYYYIEKKYNSKGNLISNKKYYY